MCALHQMRRLRSYGALRGARIVNVQEVWPQCGEAFVRNTLHSLCWHAAVAGLCAQMSASVILLCVFAAFMTGSQGLRLPAGCRGPLS